MLQMPRTIQRPIRQQTVTKKEREKNVIQNG